jgi:hypothetical protein
MAPETPVETARHTTGPAVWPPKPAAPAAITLPAGQEDVGHEPDAGQDEPEPEHLDSQPETAADLLPDSMRELVEIGLRTTHAGRDVLTLGLLALTVPLAGGVKLRASINDMDGTAPRLYALLVGPSGCGKSVVAERFQPVLLADLDARIDAANDKIKEERRELESQLKALGRSAADREAAARINNQLAERALSFKTHSIESATPEGLFRALEHDSTPLVLLDEFGALLSRAERSEREQGFLDMLTSIHDRGSAKPRITKGDDPPRTVSNISLSILATTTAEDLPQQRALSMLRGGHLARYVTCCVETARPFPDRKHLTLQEKDFCKVWRDHVIDKVALHQGRFTLSSDAAACLGEYRQAISEQFVTAINSGESDGGTIARLVGRASNFALLLHLGDMAANSGTINRETIEQACGIATYYHSKHHSRLMSYIRLGEDRTKQSSIGLRIIQALRRWGGKADVRTVYRNLHLSKTVATSVLAGLVQDGRVRYADDDKKVVALC